MKKGRTILLLLTGIFLIAEIIFNYMVLSKGNGDIYGASAKTLLFLVLILLFSKKLTWAKWILSVLLILYGALCLVVGTESGMVFYFIGLFDIFFGIVIHKRKAPRVFDEEKYDIIVTTEVERTDDQKSMFLVDGREFHYPLLVKRYKALMIDGLLLLFVLMVIMVIVEDHEFRTIIMVSSGLTVLLTYEPVLTAFSQTVGND